VTTVAPRRINHPVLATSLVGLNQQAANALLSATIEFLRKNNITKKSIVRFVEKCPARNQHGSGLKIYRQLERAQEDVGLIISTWFSHPRFLDASGSPLPLSIGKGAKSISQLVRVSGARIQPSLALELMRQSRTVRITDDGNLLALRRAFALPKLELIRRAAFVVERFLGTMNEIGSGQKKEIPFLLERSCHVSQVDLAKTIPLLRDIERQGTAFMDSIDGELEGRRLRRSKCKNIGELGVHVFLWTRPTANHLKPAKMQPKTTRIQKR
jgi:hypothetical protein